MSVTADIQKAITILRNGGVIAYPTESVYGLGCAANNATAVHRILTLKQRSAQMGVITLIDNLQQVHDWLDHDYSRYWHQAVSRWPAPVTWLFPAAADAPDWLTGGRDRLALRCPDHRLARQLCKAVPLISTSANPTQQPAAQDSEQVLSYFPEGIDCVLTGACGTQAQPSRIKDLITGETIR